MGELIGGAVVSALLTEVISLAKKTWRCAETFEKVESTLENLEPVVKQLSGREDVYQKWFKDLEGLLKEAKRIIEKYCILEEKRTWKNSVFSFLKRPDLSRLVLDIDQRIKDKIGEAGPLILHAVQSSHDKIMAHLPPAVEVSPTAEAFPSCVPGKLPAHIVSFENDPFQKLKTLISTQGDASGEHVTLGLKGPGGAGKTLLAQMLHEDTDIRVKFESVLWMTIGQDTKLPSLYVTMAKLLKDDNFERDYARKNVVDQQACVIETLKKKKTLLILDDVWDTYMHGRSMMEWLDVAKGPGSITLVTTRNNAVLTSARAKEIVDVPLLRQDEAWKLFCYNAFGIDTPPTAQIGEIAKAVCKECDGLPLALAVIGGTMFAKRKVSEWSSALESLEQGYKASKSIDKKLFRHLKFSYDDLDDVKKKCFLYFAAFPEDYRISTKMLCSIWHAEGMLASGDEDKGSCSVNQGMVNLMSLADQSMINLSEDGEVATMHDVLRDLAICIIRDAKPGEWASECYFQPGKAFQRLPKLGNMVKRLSLIGSSVSVLQESMKVPHLEVLLLRDFHIKDNKSESTLDFSKMIFSKNSKVRYLDLSYTNLKGFPEGLKKLKALEFLNLQGCESLKRLRKGIKELKALTSLDLSWSSSLEELPRGIKELIALTSLNLKRCSSLKELLGGIKELTALTSLNLKKCSLLKELPGGIKELTALTSLNLSVCSSLKELPRGIKGLTALTSLNLKRCESLKELPEGIKELTALTSLNLSQCYSLKELPEGIIGLTALISLDLSWCVCLKELPEGINELTALTSLNLSMCSSLNELPGGIKELTALTSLNLSYCRSLKELPAGIKELTALTSLNLAEYECLKELPGGIKELTALTSLNLSMCSSLKEIPRGIKELTALTSLNLSWCQSLKELPGGIKELRALTSLNLSMCSSLMELPGGINELTALTSLNLSRCSLLKKLPRGIKELTALTSLDLSWCSSLKELPRGIKRLTALTSLDLSYCSSLKELPGGIKELTALTSLDLTSLNLVNCKSLKELLGGIKGLTALTSLDLSWCKSLKELPEGIKELTALTSLKLFGCSSLKELPGGIKELTALTSLNLSWCESLKELPEGIKEFRALTSLNLSRCPSLQELPGGIKELRALTSLDLSWCVSLKELPGGIKELKALTSLNLEGCRSLKELPEGFKELTALTSLNLKKCLFMNELSGASRN